MRDRQAAQKAKREAINSDRLEYMKVIINQAAKTPGVARLLNHLS